MKQKRKAIAHYIRFKSTDPWTLIGKGISDMSVEMNGSFESTTDITGETSVSDEGYKPQISVTPYYANPEDKIYDALKNLAMNRLSGDDAKAEYLEVWAEDESATTHPAWREDCRIEIASYGGDTSGAQIAYNIWPDGNRQKGTATMADKVPTFAPDEGSLG